MYMPMALNAKKLAVMVDIGATHNFIYDCVVEALGLWIQKHASQIKAISSQSRSMLGMAKVVQVQISKQFENLNVMVIPIDDFDIILGKKFFRNHMF